MADSAIRLVAVAAAAIVAVFVLFLAAELVIVVVIYVLKFPLLHPRQSVTVTFQKNFNFFRMQFLH
jgi:hypothetical protein